MTTLTDYHAKLQEQERLSALVRTHAHSCGGNLSMAWNSKAGKNVLRCGKCLRYVAETELVKRRSLTRQYKDGDPVNPAIANRIERKLGGRIMESTELTTMSQDKMLARIDLAKFPQDLNPAEKKLLAMAAITYGFDPLMGELTIYQGRPYVSIDGRYRKARESGKLDGVTTRPATKQEREDWSIPLEDYFFRSEVSVKGMSLPLVGWGRVRMAETQGKGYKPVETNPQRMAEKRAEAQALRKAFSIPLPSAEDIGLEDEPTFEVQEIKPTQLSEATEDSLAAWAGPFAAESQKTASKPKSQGIVQGEAVKAPAAQPSAPAEVSLASLGELWGRCNARGITIDAAFKILKVEKGTDWLGTPDEAWATIKDEMAYQRASGRSLTGAYSPAGEPGRVVEVKHD